MMFRRNPCHVPVVDGYSGLRARRLTFKKVVKEVMRGQLMNQFQHRMEDTLRRIVREELERLFQPLHLSSQRSTQSSLIEPQVPETQPPLHLRFINSLPPAIFTGSRIEANDGSAIVIELVNTYTNSRVTAGSLASSRVEIVALDGDFTEENWDSEKFRRSILRPRNGKRPLLTGELLVNLHQGVGSINGDVVFTDNSSWTRGKQFRIGARISQLGSPCSQVKEGRSEAFVCKDHRGESYKKHYPPFPDDEAWRLEKIAKGGILYKRLTKHGIRTVKDFRRAYAMSPTCLRNILGEGTGVHNKTWELIVRHALLCVLDENEYYIYRGLTQGASLLLNSVFEVVKVSFDDRFFQNVAQIDFNQRVVVEELKREAYDNVNSFIRVNGQAFAEAPPRPLTCPQDVAFSLANPGLHQIHFQDEPGNPIYFDQTGLMSFDQSSAPTVRLTGHLSRVLSSALRNSFRVREENPGDGSQGEVVPMGHAHVFAAAGWSPGSTSWAQQVYGSLYDSELDGVLPDIDVQMVGSPRGRWCKIRAALKFRKVLKDTATRNRGLVYKHY